MTTPRKPWPIAPKPWERTLGARGGHVWRCIVAHGKRTREWCIYDVSLTFHITLYAWHGRVESMRTMQIDYDTMRRTEGWAEAEKMGAPPRPADWLHGVSD